MLLPFLPKTVSQRLIAFPNFSHNAGNYDDDRLPPKSIRFVLLRTLFEINLLFSEHKNILAVNMKYSKILGNKNQVENHFNSNKKLFF